MSSLDFSLRDHLPLALRPVAVDYLWGPQPSPFAFQDGKTNLQAYFELYFRYYSRQCDLIGRYANGKYSSVETHRDIMDIAQLLQKPLTREEVRKCMSDFLKFADVTQHDNSINLVARLLLMTKIGNVPHECLGGKPIEWQCGDLRTFMHKHFHPVPTRGHDRIKLEKSFNALNVQRIAGIQIWWTDNLADHLKMMNDDRAVFVFHHASFLAYQLQNPLYPAHFIEDTLRTMALFFPRYDSATKKWYLKAAANSTRPLDMQLISVGNLNSETRQIENFGYWHDRLVILKEVYDEARPKTLSQFWYDRRNGPQWYTFWVALLVLVLSVFAIIIELVQCVESGLQIYIALKS